MLYAYSKITHNSKLICYQLGCARVTAKLSVFTSIVFLLMFTVESTYMCLSVSKHVWV